MADVWVISDTHFNHKNILNFTDSTSGLKTRPFTSLGEMNECMTDNWNEVVKPQDKIYHLGDVFFGDPDKADAILDKLNGKKRLVLGNHDDPYKLPTLMHHFQKVLLWRVWATEKMIWSHIPLHQSTLEPRLAQYHTDGEVGAEPIPCLNVHGHIHQNQSPEGPYRNVSVEATGYKPIHIDELRS